MQCIMLNAQSSKQRKSVSAQNDYPNLKKVLDGFLFLLPKSNQNSKIIKLKNPRML